MLLCVRSQIRCSSASQQKEVSGQSEQSMLQAPSDRGIFSFPVCHDQRIQTPPYVSRIFGSLLSSVELIGVSISNRTFRSYWYVVLPELSVVHVERQHPRYKHSISLLLWCAIHFFFLFNNNRQLSCAVHIKKVCYIFFWGTNRRYRSTCSTLFTTTITYKGSDIVKSTQSRSAHHSAYRTSYTKHWLALMVQVEYWLWAAIWQPSD